MKALLAVVLLSWLGTGAGAANPQAEAAPEADRRGYELKARRQLELLKLQLTDAEIEARELGSQARQKADERVAALRKQADEAQTELAGLQRSAQSTWRTVRKRMDSTIESLRREYEGLRKDLEDDRR